MTIPLANFVAFYGERDVFSFNPSGLPLGEWRDVRQRRLSSGSVGSICPFGGNLSAADSARHPFLGRVRTRT